MDLSKGSDEDHRDDYWIRFPVKWKTPLLCFDYGLHRRRRLGCGLIVAIGRRSVLYILPLTHTEEGQRDAEWYST